jgi:hypothetical protein
MCDTNLGLTATELALALRHYTMAAMLVASGGGFAPGTTLDTLSRMVARNACVDSSDADITAEVRAGTPGCESCQPVCCRHVYLQMPTTDSCLHASQFQLGSVGHLLCAQSMLTVNGCLCCHAMWMLPPPCRPYGVSCWPAS